MAAPARTARRLAAARAALALAEQRAGLASARERSVTDLPGSSHADPWHGLGPASSGAVALSGSTSLLLAAAARRQGRQGWCAVVGGADLGWCAAAATGMDLERVLVVPTQGDSLTLLGVLAALIDGVDVIVVTREAAGRLSRRHQRTAAARARERGALLLTDHAWESGRSLRAEPQGAGPLAPVLPLDGTASPHQAAEMPRGYLASLTWTLHGGQGAPASRATMDASGLRLEGAAPPAARAPRLRSLPEAS